MPHFCVYPLHQIPPLATHFTACPAGKDISISGSDNPPVGPCESNEDRCDANDREVAEISRSTDDNRLAKDKKKDLDQEQKQQQQQQQQEPLSEEQNFKKQKVSTRHTTGLGSHGHGEIKSLARQLM